VAAKHGAVGLVKTLALEGADHGIAAVAVCSGYVKHAVGEKQVRDQARHAQPPEERVLRRSSSRPRR
jgi:3-hydroxybutyrate dehydrogenase